MRNNYSHLYLSTSFSSTRKKLPINPFCMPLQWCVLPLDKLISRVIIVALLKRGYREGPLLASNPPPPPARHNLSTGDDCHNSSTV